MPRPPGVGIASRGHHPGDTSATTHPEAPMAGASARPSREDGRSGPAQDSRTDAARDDQDTAPGDDKISRERADYAPTGADPKPTTGGTIKRTLTEFSEDGLTDWAAALTYYGILAVFPALVALLSIIGLLVDPKTLTDALTTVVPKSAGDALT